MIAQIVLIVPVISNNVQMIKTIIWKAAQMNAKDWPNDWDDPSWVLPRQSGRSCKFWSDHIETLTDVWDDQDDNNNKNNYLF